MLIIVVKVMVSFKFFEIQKILIFDPPLNISFFSSVCNVFLHLITGQTMDVCGGLSLYNNYMKGYQNMDSLYEKMLADKAAKEAGGNSK